MMLKPEAFEAAFNAWIARLRDEAVAATGVERPIIAIDGKTARRSHDAAKELGALHVVTAWAGEYGLALGQQACAEKSNEITAIPELLKKIDVKGGIVTIDAMGAQKAIAEEVIRGKADYVLALKRNHETLHAAVIEHIDERLEGDLEDAQELTTTDRGHGREEERTYLQLPVPEGLPGKADWEGLESVGVVTSLRKEGQKESIEVRYYLRNCTKRQFAPIIGHEEQTIPIRFDKNSVAEAPPASAPGQARWTASLREPPRSPQRHLLHRSGWLCLADDAP